MPEMDGFEATKIRKMEKPPIIAHSKGNERWSWEILNAGASDYQSKPIDIQQLISLIVFGFINRW
jgi:CheY-like chemotaxis protein